MKSKQGQLSAYACVIDPKIDTLFLIVCYFIFLGMCLVIVGHPLDLIKVKLQAGGGQYKGALDAATKTLRSEGVRET